MMFDRRMHARRPEAGLAAVIPGRQPPNHASRPSTPRLHSPGSNAAKAVSCGNAVAAERRVCAARGVWFLHTQRMGMTTFRELRRTARGHLLAPPLRRPARRAVGPGVSRLGLRRSAGRIGSPGQPGGNATVHPTLPARSPATGASHPAVPRAATGARAAKRQSARRPARRLAPRQAERAAPGRLAPDTPRGTACAPARCATWCSACSPARPATRSGRLPHSRSTWSRPPARPAPSTSGPGMCCCRSPPGPGTIWTSADCAEGRGFAGHQAVPGHADGRADRLERPALLARLPGAGRSGGSRKLYARWHRRAARGAIR